MPDGISCACLHRGIRLNVMLLMSLFLSLVLSIVLLPTKLHFNFTEVGAQYGKTRTPMFWDCNQNRASKCQRKPLGVG